MLLLSRLTRHLAYVSHALPGLVLGGLAMGLIVAPAFSTATLGVLAAGQVLMLLLLKGSGHSNAADILPALFLIGIGFGFSLPTIIGSATHDLAAKRSATGSAVVKSGQQVAGVFGTATLVVILAAATTGDLAKYYHLWWLAAVTCAAAALTSLGLTLRQTEEAPGTVASSLVAVPER
jgi:hypothetical protein